MGDFDDFDLRGFRIVFPQDRWDHTVGRSHVARVKGNYAAVMQAFKNCPLVISQQTDGRDGRVANECYVSPIPPILVPDEEPECKYLLIPAIVLDQPRTRPGAPPLEAGTRIGWTAYPSTTVPDGEVLFKWPPDPK